CLIIACTLAAAEDAPCGLVPYELRCEYATTPLGIDDPHPRLSWKLRSADPLQRGVTQSAYQILVASERDVLDQDLGDLWDSGKVVSSDTLHVVYRGEPLEAGRRVWWKVRVWDQSGAVSRYSARTWWEMGLPSDQWHAEWIQDSKPPESEDPDPFADHPAPRFRTEFAVSKPIERARAYVSGLGYYEMHLNGDRVGNRSLDPGWTSYDK